MSGEQGVISSQINHFRKLWKERGFIHMNLVTALGITNFAFLFQTVPDVKSVGVYSSVDLHHD